jgi:hypothetical protein
VRACAEALSKATGVVFTPDELQQACGSFTNKEKAEAAAEGASGAGGSKTGVKNVSRTALQELLERKKLALHEFKRKAFTERFTSARLDEVRAGLIALAELEKKSAKEAGGRKKRGAGGGAGGGEEDAAPAAGGAGGDAGEGAAGATGTKKQRSKRGGARAGAAGAEAAAGDAAAAGAGAEAAPAAAHQPGDEFMHHDVFNASVQDAPPEGAAAPPAPDAAGLIRPIAQRAGAAAGDAAAH